MAGPKIATTDASPNVAASDDYRPTAADQERPAVPVRRLTWAGLLAATAISAAEVDRLLGESLGAGGRTATAPWTWWSAWGNHHRTAFDTWPTVHPYVTTPFDHLPWVHLILTAAVTAIVLWPARRTANASGPWTRAGWLVAAWAKGAELAGCAIVLANAHFRKGYRPAGLWMLTGLWWAAWIGLGLFVVTAWAQGDAGGKVARLRSRTAGLTAALWHHRISVLVVGLVGAVGLVPGPDIIDQTPDIIRSWVRVTWTRPAGWTHAGMTLVAALVSAGMLLVLGRLRSRREWFKYALTGQTPWQRPSRLYLVGPLLAVSVAAALAATGHSELIDPTPLGITVAVPVTLWAVSYALYCHRICRQRNAAIAAGVIPATADPRDVPPPTIDIAQATSDEEYRSRITRARMAWVTGDVLAGLIVIVLGLALVRAFAAPLLLALPALVFDDARNVTFTGPDDWWKTMANEAVFLIGGVLTVLAWPRLWERLLNRFDQTDRVPRPARSSDLDDGFGRSTVGSFGPLATGLVVGAACFLFAVILVPLQIGRLVGIVALALFILTAWGYIVGYFVVQLQRYKPLEIFYALGFRSAPLMTMLLVLPYAVSVKGGDPDVHLIRAGASPAYADRLTLHEAFQEWVNRDDACTITAGRDKIRPMLLVAAAGGGIRAAYWTANAMNDLNDNCAGRSVFLSSGISGGAVGLTIARSPHPDAVVDHLAGPEGLGGAVAGLLVSDLVGGVVGLRLPSSTVDGWGWHDRADLMESAWLDTGGLPPDVVDGMKDLRRPWSGEPSGPVGYLVLNSAAAGGGCRVLISQINFLADKNEPVSAWQLGPDAGQPGPASADPLDAGDESAREQPRCRSLTGLPAATTDLMTFYEECTPAMDWLTASMLAARFPTVTPAGRTPGSSRRTGDDSPAWPCSDRADLQLVDGGYAEGSGIGTLVDLSHLIMAEVREHNRAEATKPESDTARTFVVPLVVYVDNHFGGDIVPPAPSLAAESVVPLAGLNAPGVVGNVVATGSRCLRPPVPHRHRPLWSASERAARTAHGGSHRRSAGQHPAVTAPLGWTLSYDSRIRLKRALGDQALAPQDSTGKPVTVANYCRGNQPGSYACLGLLLKALGAASSSGSETVRAGRG